MLKKTVTYTDFDDKICTEELYFNLTKAEVIEMQWSKKDGLHTLLTTLMKSKDTPAFIAILKEFIVKAYGVKSEDNKRFIKNDEVRSSFEYSAAYSEVFTEIVSEDTKALEFILGVIPREIADEVRSNLEEKNNTK